MVTCTGAMPLALSARERLRDQQQHEARRLAAVLAAQRRLATEQEKAAVVIEKAQHGISARQAAVDDAVLALIDTSGIARTAILLDRPENELARLQRSRQRRLHGGNGPEAGDPGVPA